MSGLVWVGQVTDISPIENADRIESAEVVCGPGGKWRGVVKKGDFAVGQPCTVYLQDAIVPPSPEMAFLEKSGWRVRMARFRGARSECVITPATDGYSVGEDLTERLGVKKYEKPLPISLSGDALGNFPAFIPRTDEPNFQRVPEMVEALRGKPWYATVKCDGTSTTAYRMGDHFGVCSRNLELKEGDNVYWEVAKKHRLDQKLPDGVALQWETCGPGVQKNPLGMQSMGGFAFQAWNIKERKYLSVNDFVLLCVVLRFPIAGFVVTGHDFDLDEEGLLRLAEGVYGNGKQREGIVVRPMEEQLVNGDRLSFKVLNLLYKD